MGLPDPSDIDRTARRVVPFLFLTVFLDLVGFGIVLPLLPFYVEAMGGTAETVGFIFTVFSLTQLAVTPVLGRLSDRIGRRPVILISLAGNVLSMLAFALASKLLLLPLLFASRLVAGATAGNLAACQASIADITTEQERAVGMGRLGAGINLGLILGPLVGSTLSHFGAWMPPLAAAGLAFLDFLGALFLMPETRHLRSLPPPPPDDFHPEPEPERRWAWLRRPRVLSVLSLFFFTFLCLTSMQVALALLAKLRLDWGPKQVGYVFAVFAAVSLIIQAFLLGRLARVMGEGRLMLLGWLFSAAGMLLIGYAHAPLTLMSGVAMLGLGFGANMPLLTTLASRAASAQTRGVVLGFAQSAGGLARAVGPVLGGILFHRVAPQAPFVGGAIAALLCVAIGLSAKLTQKS